jgi:hypothetical protein
MLEARGGRLLIRSRRTTPRRGRITADLPKPTVLINASNGDLDQERSRASKLKSILASRERTLTNACFVVDARTKDR